MLVNLKSEICTFLYAVSQEQHYFSLLSIFYSNKPLALFKYKEPG